MCLFAFKIPFRRTNGPSQSQILPYDENTKIPLYAAAGVREVWIVNLQDNWIDCYCDPAPRTYRRRERFFAGDTIHPDTLPEVSIDVGYILNPLASAD